MEEKQITTEIKKQSKTTRLMVGGIGGLFVGLGMIAVGILLTLTLIGAIIGIPLIIIGVIFMIVGPIAGLAIKKAECPYCHAKLTIGKQALDCPVCKKRLFVKDEKLVLVQ